MRIAFYSAGAVAGLILFGPHLWTLATEWRQIQEGRWTFNRIYSFGRGYPTEPSPFLVEASRGLRPGRALDLGAGQGRNTLYLARQGWDVTALDISEKGLAAAEAEAARERLKISTVLKAIEDFDFGRNQWDLITMMYVPVRYQDPQLIRRVCDSLRPGAALIVESVIDSPAEKQRRGPQRGDLEPNELKRVFGSLEIQRYEEKPGISEWFPHETTLVRMFARKPG